MESISISKVKSNPYQIRLDYPRAEIKSLAADIRIHGLVQTPVGRMLNDGTVQLAFGHSRLAAWKLARPHELFPIVAAPLTDRQMLEYAISENVQRHDLSAIEKAKALHTLTTEFNATQQEAGRLFGLGQSAVSNLMRLLELPADIQHMVHDGRLPERKARALIGIARKSKRSAQRGAKRMAAGTAGSVRVAAPACYHCGKVPEFYRRRGAGFACSLCDRLSTLIASPLRCTRCEIVLENEDGPHCATCVAELGAQK